VFDATHRRRYPFGTMLPGITPRRLLDNGYVKRSDSLAGLAAACGIDAAGLTATLERFNALARSGVDSDFGRGGNAYDAYYGDPRVHPNPCLAPVERPPFYAVELFPGDLGTKGGLVTDERGRVLREDGGVVPGLYASGNTTASVMGRRYPGPGVTLASALTFAHLAMRDAATSG
jgi:3-oxosteroid 1-dehydrogenase